MVLCPIVPNPIVSGIGAQIKDVTNPSSAGCTANSIGIAVPLECRHSVPGFAASITRLLHLDPHSAGNLAVGNGAVRIKSGVTPLGIALVSTLR